MTDQEQAVLHAVIHEINVRFEGDSPEAFDRETTLESLKLLARNAEKIIAGNAASEDLRAIGDSLHPQTQALFRLKPPPARRRAPY